MRYSGCGRECQSDSPTQILLSPGMQPGSPSNEAPAVGEPLIGTHLYVCHGAKNIITGVGVHGPDNNAKKAVVTKGVL